MPKLVFSAFCQQVIIDRVTNNISLINQLDMLNVQKPREVKPLVQKRGEKKKPHTLAALQSAVVSVWEREKPTISESSELRVELIGPGRESLATFSATLDLRKTRRTRQIGLIPGIPLVGEGTYRFVLRCRHGVKWKRAGDVSFQVNYGLNPQFH